MVEPAEVTLHNLSQEQKYLWDELEVQHKKIGELENGQQQTKEMLERLTKVVQAQSELLVLLSKSK